jgi:hypothetical protein
MAIHTAFTSGHASLPVYTTKTSTDTWFPILLVDKTDGITGEAGIVYGNVDVDFGLASATSLTAYTPATADWKELGEGMYALRIGAGEFGSVGRYFVRVGDDAPAAGKCVFVVETFAVTKDELVRGTTPANTLDIDANGLVDVSKFNGTAAVINGTTNLLSVDVGAISSDATAANTLETIIEGSVLLSVDATKISGDTTAADNLELFTEALGSGGVIDAGTLASGTITAAKIASNAITNAKIASDFRTQMADDMWDEAKSGHTTSGTFGEQCGTDIDAILADTGTDGVKIDLTQAMAETGGGVADLTIGRALYLTLAHYNHKWTTSGGVSTIYKNNGTDVFSTRTITSTSQIEDHKT